MSHLISTVCIWLGITLNGNSVPYQQVCVNLPEVELDLARTVPNYLPSLCAIWLGSSQFGQFSAIRGQVCVTFG
jgi:hypothetical protein